MFNGRITPKAIRIIVAAKLVLVATVLITLDQGLFFGDKKSSAADATADEKAGKDAAKDPKATAEAKADTKDDKADTAGRKSFLDDLLTLPKLDPNSIKKDEVGRYLAMAERKKQQVDDRVAALAKREAQLRELEDTIDQKLERLDEDRQFLNQTVQQEKDLKDKRLDELVAFYKKMEVKKAAPVFEKLDKDLVVSLFKRLPEKQITAILAKMDPKRSVELTEYYGRVKSMREYDLMKEMNQSLKKEFEDCKGMPKQQAASADAPPPTADASPTPSANTAAAN